MSASGLRLLILAGALSYLAACNDSSGAPSIADIELVVSGVGVVPGDYKRTIRVSEESTTITYHYGYDEPDGSTENYSSHALEWQRLCQFVASTELFTEPDPQVPLIVGGHGNYITVAVTYDNGAMSKVRSRSYDVDAEPLALWAVVRVIEGSAGAYSK